MEPAPRKEAQDHQADAPCAALGSRLLAVDDRMAGPKHSGDEGSILATNRRPRTLIAQRPLHLAMNRGMRNHRPGFASAGTCQPKVDSFPTFTKQASPLRTRILPEQEANSRRLPTLA